MTVMLLCYVVLMKNLQMYRIARCKRTEKDATNNFISPLFSIQHGMCRLERHTKFLEERGTVGRGTDGRGTVGSVDQTQTSLLEQAMDHVQEPRENGRDAKGKAQVHHEQAVNDHKVANVYGVRFVDGKIPWAGIDDPELRHGRGWENHAQDVVHVHGCRVVVEEVGGWVTFEDW